MSKEVIIVKWCDGDHGDDRRRADVEHVIAIDGGSHIQLDLCNEHDELIRTVSQLVDKGEPVGVAPPAINGRQRRPYKRKNSKNVQGEFPCPLCSMVSVSDEGLKFHFRKHHDEGTLLEWRKRQGL